MQYRHENLKSRDFYCSHKLVLLENVHTSPLLNSISFFPALLVVNFSTAKIAKENSSTALEHLLHSVRAFKSNKTNKQRKTNET
jgi:hypothetical protein